MNKKSTLVVGKGPATQLLEMWWAEQYSPGQFGVIARPTYSLIAQKLVAKRQDGLSVELTAEGRTEARMLAEGASKIHWQQLLSAPRPADAQLPD